MNLVRGQNRRRSYLRSAWDVELPALDVSHEMRACSQCGGEHLAPVAEKTPQCFACWRKAHPFEGVAAARIDAAGEDSTDPRRIADGTAHLNLGMPPVEKVVGTRVAPGDPNLHGRPALEMRPMTNREVSSNVRRRELAARAGLQPVERGVYRSVR